MTPEEAPHPADPLLLRASGETAGTPPNPPPSLLREVQALKFLPDQAERILESITDAFFALDGEWRFTYLNGQAQKVLQRQPGELIGYSIWEIYPGLAGSPFEEAYHRTVREQAATSFTSYYPDHDRWYEVHAYPASEGITVYFRDVTGRKKIEAERAQLMEDSERQRRVYETVLANMADSIYVFDLEGRFTYANEALLSVWQRPLSDALGRTLAELDYPPDLAAKFQAQIQEVIATKRSLRDEATFTNKRGLRSYEYIFNPIFGPDGAVEGVAGSTRDTTERKQVEIALRASEERYRAAAAKADSAAEANAKFRVFFEQGSQFAGVLTLDGTLIEANRLSLEASGFRREEVIGKKFWDCGWWAPSPATVRLVRDACFQAAMGSVWHQETQFHTADGTIRDVEMILAPVTDERGEVLFIAATGSDITDRRLAEAVVRESDVRIRRMADSAPVLIWETTAAGEGLSFVNHQYLSFFGVPFADLRGEGWTRFLHPDDRDGYLEVFQDSSVLRQSYEYQARFLRHDGEYRWLLNTGFPNYGPEGRFTGLVGSSSDVTDLKNAEEAQRRLAAELSLADRKKDEFLALLAHELRNPLAPIQTGLEIMHRSANNEAVMTKTRGIMERQLGHMVQLIDDLLDISRISANKLELRVTRTDLAEILQSAVETARPAIDAAGHQFFVAVPEEPVALDADVTRLAQVISNLLLNSAKYTPYGGRIRLAAALTDEGLAITVQDTGIGIPAGSQESIFSMFSQVDRSIERSTGGLGIGLALVKGLVELHGGTVRVASPGQDAGSTFTVVLPLPERADNGAEERTAAAREGAAQRRRILVVDDNRDAALSLATLLEMLGNEMATAHDGEAAIERAREFRPDVIFMDVGMPGLSGYDATRRIRREDWGEKIRIVALTGWGKDSDREDSREAGCDAHLVKPVRLAEVQAVLEG